MFYDEHQDQDDYYAGEKQDEAQGDGNGGISSQPYALVQDI